VSFPHTDADACLSASGWTITSKDVGNAFVVRAVSQDTFIRGWILSLHLMVLRLAVITVSLAKYFHLPVVSHPLPIGVAFYC